MVVIFDADPHFQSERFFIRPVCTYDVDGLVALFGDKKTVSMCNRDNINDTCFEFNDKAAVIRLVRFWQNHFRAHKFMRCAIFEKKSDKIIGSLELFKRECKDEFDDCCILKLDLRGRYEKVDIIEEIIASIFDLTFLGFDSFHLATKVTPKATERMKAIENLGFDLTQQSIPGVDGETYGDYYIYTQPEKDRWVYQPKNRRLVRE